MGKKYYEYDLPRLIESNQQLAKQLKRQNDINEKQVRLGKIKQPRLDNTDI